MYIVLLWFFKRKNLWLPVQVSDVMCASGFLPIYACKCHKSGRLRAMDTHVGYHMSLSMFSSVQSLSRVWLSETPWIAACQAPCPSPTPRVYSNSCPLSQWCHPTVSSSVVPFFSCLSSFPASGSFLTIGLFTSDGQSIRVNISNEYWNYSNEYSNEYSGLISFRMDWLDLLAVQGALKSLLQLSL